MLPMKHLFTETCSSFGGTYTNSYGLYIPPTVLMWLVSFMLKDCWTFCKL